MNMLTRSWSCHETSPFTYALQHTGQFISYLEIFIMRFCGGDYLYFKTKSDLKYCILINGFGMNRE